MVHKALNELEGITCNEADGALYAFPRIRLSNKAKEAAEAKGVPPDEYYCIKVGSGTKKALCVVYDPPRRRRFVWWYMVLLRQCRHCYLSIVPLCTISVFGSDDIRAWRLRNIFHHRHVQKALFSVKVRLASVRKVASAGG